MHSGQHRNGQTILRHALRGWQRVLAVHKRALVHGQTMRRDALLAPGVENLLDRTTSCQDWSLPDLPMHE